MIPEPLPPAPESWIWDEATPITAPVLTSDLPSVPNVSVVPRSILPDIRPFFGIKNPPPTGWVLADKIILNGAINYLFVAKENGRFYFRFASDAEGQDSPSLPDWTADWLLPTEAAEDLTDPIVAELDATAFAEFRQTIDLGGEIATYFERDTILKYGGKWVTNYSWDLAISFTTADAYILAIWLVQIDGYFCFYHTFAAFDQLVNHAEYTYTGRPTFAGALPFISDTSAGAPRPSPATLDHPTSETALRVIMAANNSIATYSDSPLTDAQALAALAPNIPDAPDELTSPTYINNGAYRTLLVLYIPSFVFESFNISQSWSFTITYPPSN